MSLEAQNPTASSDGGASTLNPEDRIQAWLDASDGDSTNQSGAGDKPAPDDKPATPDKPDDGDLAKDAEPQITTAQLAAFLGIEESEIDVDEDGQPVFKNKIDGKESAAKFSDIRKAYQLSGHAENRVREAAEREKAADRKLQEADQAIQAKYQEQQESLKGLYSMNAVLQEELKGEYQAVNWDALWQQDPAQARNLERRFEARQTRINGVFQQLHQRDAQAKQQAESLRKANEEKAKESQVKRLFELIPEWKDATVAEKERQELLGWVSSSGFDASDMDLNKASQVALLRRAWQHDTLQKSRPAIENKVRTAPKLVKPGQAPQSEGNAGVLKTLKQQVRTATGGKSTDAAAAWLVAKGIA